VDGPLIALLTDFGLDDHYVGVVKAVVAGIAPRARLLDLCHAVRPRDVRGGAYLLMAAVEYLPAGSIVLAVVDPGVGSTRRAIAVGTGELTFVGPDNGLLSWALWRLARVGRADVALAGAECCLGPDAAAVVLDRPELWLPRVSTTFHGRDLFGPVAAHLARGVPLRDLGTPTDRVVALPWPTPLPDGAGACVARVVHVDHFGNLVTSVEPGAAPLRRLEIAGRQITALSPHFVSDAPLIALVGSSGLLEIAVPGGSAAAELGVGVDAPVRVWLGAPSGGSHGPRVSSE